MTASGVPHLHEAIIGWLRDFADQGVFTTDTELRVVMWNRWLESHSGRLAAEVVGRPLLEVFPELAARRLDQHYQAALQGQSALLSHKLHGRLLPLAARVGATAPEMAQRTRIVPLSDESRIIGTMTIVDDVSERVASERELRKQIEAQAAARAAPETALRVKDDFLATLSHEIRTPLNAVRGWARILRDRPSDSGLLARALEMIDRNSAIQARLIDDMLDTARMMAGKLRLEMQMVDLLAVTTSALDGIAPEAAAREVEIRRQLDPTVGRVLGDPVRLEQVIWNLLSNALKFSDTGGLIDVTLQARIGLARLTIRDTGRGISPEFLPFVFERFRQGDATSNRRAGGLGLGLALVRELVELHGGSVRAESAGEGHGAMFQIDVPTLADEEAEIQPRRAVGPGAELPFLEGLRVLVVDDDPDALDLVVTTLTQHGARVTSAVSCADALAHISNSLPEDRPRVIVSDIGMAGADGYELIQRVRALRPEEGGTIPAIALTAYANPEERVRALTAGYQRHLAKPVDPLVLVRAVTRLASQAERLSGPTPGKLIPD